MGETTRQADAVSTDRTEPVEQSRQLLRVVYGLFPVVAGADKFTNVLADWVELLPAAVAGLLPLEPQLFMYVVGVIEIVAGVVVFLRTEYGAYLVAAWLVAVAATQVVGGNLDVAVRDVWIAVGAVALARLTAGTSAS